jgi:hypothetical protein
MAWAVPYDRRAEKLSMNLMKRDGDFVMDNLTLMTMKVKAMKTLKWRADALVSTTS